MINKKYDNQSSAIASYDYQDLADNTGRKSFYCTEMKSSSATTYHLIQEAFYSTTIMISRTTPGSTAMNFDLTAFNLPQIVAAGTAYLSCFIGMGAGGGGDTTSAVSIQLQKISGAVTTNISSTITTSAVTISDDAKYYSVLLPITTTKTEFKKGDVLRAVINLIYGAGTTTGKYIEIGIDPMGRAATNIITPLTVMKLNIPFDLDL